MKHTWKLATIAAVFFCIFFGARVNAAEWIDVTDAYVINPRYETNSYNGWNVEYYYGNYNINNNAAEMWYAYFRLGQQLSGLPNGQYRLSLNGYYRPGDFDSYEAANYDESTAQVDAYIYAGGQQKKLKSVYSEYTTTRYNGDSQLRVDWNFRYYPNSMAGASARFSQNMYLNQLEFEVTDGTVDIGVECDYRADRNWTIWSNWKLEYYGTLTPVTSISFDKTRYTIERTKRLNVVPTVLPDNATIKVVGWESSDEDILYVDKDYPGYFYGVAPGTVTLRCTAKDGSGVYKNVQVTVWQTDVTGITLNKSSMQMDKGATFQLNATVSPSNATIKTIQWTSSNTSVATVDENGLVTAVDNGNCTITAASTDGSGKQSVCQLTVTSNPPTTSNLFINEIQTRNVDMYIDPSFNYGGWVELYNPTNSAVDLDQVYICDPVRGYEVQLPDDFGAIPAKGYKNVWFDHYDGQYGKLAYKQVNWKLDADGGTVAIKSKNGELLAQQTYPAMTGRTSYARQTNGTGAFAITAQPTPEATNTTSAFVTTQISAPTVDYASALFTSPFTFTVSYPSNATLVYTTDGSTPTLTNGVQSTGGGMSETVTGTAIYRFRVFKDGMIPSEVVTRSWIFKDREYDQPCVIVNTAPENLYDNTIGIYTRGTNGRSGNGVTGTGKANWNMDWDRPVNFEYIDENKDINFSQEVDMSISGGWSRMWGMTYSNLLSFKLKATKIYGINELSHVWFDAKPYNKYKQLMLRNGGNDTYNKSRCKDNMLQQILIRSGLYIDAQETSLAHVFLNGQFKGTMNIREVTNKEYGYSNYGLDTDLQDAFEMSVDSGYVQTRGDRVAFEEWYEEAKTADDESSWNRIKELVDIDEFINYFAVQLYMNNWDWPHNNLKAFRDKSDSGKFHFVIFDLDNCFDRSFNPFSDFANQYYYTFYPIYNEDGSSYRITEEVEMVTIFLNMLQNDEFKKRFIDAYCVIAGSVFEPERCAEIVEEIRQKMYYYMSWENSQGYVNDHAAILTNNITSAMQTTQVNYMANYLSVSASNRLTASVRSNLESAQLKVNDMPVPTGKFSGRLYYPVTLKASAPGGYKFVGWMDTNSSPTSQTLFPMNSTWQYYDQGDLTSTDWKTTGNQVSWSMGNGLFGFHTRDDGAVIVTTIDGGPAGNKRPTYYFRKTFNLASKPASDDAFRLEINFDDGYIIHVNGQEVATKRLPSGAGYNVYASAYGSDPYDTDYLEIPASYFKSGENVIAIEVHNQSATSSDMYFDASLSVDYGSAGGGGTIVGTEPELELEADENYNLTAMWEPMTEAEKREAGVATTPIVINEISAGNSVYINDFYKKDDWIELYNTTDEPIDLKGLCLTDRRDNPAKWEITAATKSDPTVLSKASTIIPAHGYKIIWCGDRYKKVTADNTQLHSNFKLSNAEEEERYVAIGKFNTATNKYEWVDSISYCVMNGDQTVGRFPDASNECYLMTLPTIDKQNVLTMYAQEYNPTSISSPSAVMANREGSLSIRYYGGNLYISSEDADEVSVSIYNMSGALLSRTDVRVSGGRAVVNVSGLDSGLYVARATADGEDCGTKFLK